MTDIVPDDCGNDIRTVEEYPVLQKNHVISNNKREEIARFIYVSVSCF
jgi:hypothetical protein